MAVAYLSMAIDGALILHKVMEHLVIEDHLALFQTCSTFRRIIALETGPAVACSIFPAAVSKVLEKLAVDDVDGGPLPSTQMTLLIRIMAFNTASAAAVLVTAAGEYKDINLFDFLCSVFEEGPDADPKKPPEFLWECCNDAELLTAASRKRKRESAEDSDLDTQTFDLFFPDDGVDSINAIASGTLCTYHRRWLQSVMLIILTHPCFTKNGIMVSDLVEICLGCRNSKFLVTYLLPELERGGSVSLDPCSLPPAFDFMPESLYPKSHGKAVNQSYGVDIVVEDVTDELFWAVYESGLDPLLDQILLRYRPSFSMLNDVFREACKGGYTTVAMRILEVRGDMLDLADEENGALEDSVSAGHHETVEFLLWIGRKGMDSDSANGSPASWLQSIRSNLEELAAKPGKGNEFSITLSGIRAAADHPAIINPLIPRRMPIRRSASKTDPSTLYLLVDAAGGWQSLLENDVVHDDIPFIIADGEAQGAEDLLLLACKEGSPTVAKDVVEKMRGFLRSRYDLATADAVERITRFETALSVCLCFALRDSEEDTLSIVKCLLFESSEAEITVPQVDPLSHRRLIASPAFRDGMALQGACSRGQQAVVSLFLADPRLTSSARNKALARACHKRRTTLVAQLLAHPGIDPHRAGQELKQMCFEEAVLFGSTQPLTTKVALFLETHQASNPLLSCAIFIGDIRLIVTLLADPRIEPGGVTPLKMACILKAPEILEELLSSDRYLKILHELPWGRDAMNSNEDGEADHQTSTSLADTISCFFAEHVLGFGNHLDTKDNDEDEQEVDTAMENAHQDEQEDDLGSEDSEQGEQDNNNHGPGEQEIDHGMADAERGPQEDDLEKADDELRWFFTLRELMIMGIVDPRASKNLMIRAAAAKGWLRVVELMMGYRGPDVEPADDREIISRLPGIVDPSDVNNEALRSAAHLKDHSKAAEIAGVLLYDKRVDPSTNDSEPFRVAAARGNVELLTRLVSSDLAVWDGKGPLPTPKTWRFRRIDPNARNGEALLEAIRRNHVETVRFLLEKVPQLRHDVNDNAAMKLAQKLDRRECLRLLEECEQQQNEPKGITT
ncbi:hypothetical protein HDU96_006159 [Phlyctochytrium bullatum]|nr:hypothetical protein HDU96_006159 [Phlyctochytrium bullatum]